ncbi:unnamed protein product [Mytilus coruscus]|uniref:2'-phosphotransferase n=1 Tax=Mytilus coruscus TaxID=42192 RepID=A0A6J8ETA1_MYTCO|nr:unnamed protein product [Mytilus coruscus]
MSGRYEDHPEAYQEYPMPHVRVTMAPERAQASAWKAELEKTDRKFDQKLGQVHEKLDDIMDQFKKLLTRPIARSPSPGGWVGAGDCYHYGERERDLENGWWKIKANQEHSIDVGSFGMPLVEENEVAQVYHYTTMLAWGDIAEEALSLMGRQHIHLLSEEPSSFKPHWEVQIMIDVPRVQTEGYEFSGHPVGLFYARVTRKEFCRSSSYRSHSSRLGGAVMVKPNMALLLGHGEAEYGASFRPW